MQVLVRLRVVVLVPLQVVTCALYVRDAMLFFKSYFTDVHKLNDVRLAIIAYRYVQQNTVYRDDEQTDGIGKKESQ